MASVGVPRVLKGFKRRVPENLVELVDLAVALEEGLFEVHFGEDAACRPDVDGSGVFNGAQEDFRSTVPQRDHLMGVRSCGDLEHSGQAKVRDLDGV